MPKQKPENKLTDKEQARRFREAAKEAEVDAEKAEKAFQKIAKADGPSLPPSATSGAKPRRVD